MMKHNQDGAANGLVVSLVLTVILLLAAIGFGAWAFSSRQDYKDNSDAKSAAAVQKAVAQESTTKDKQFAEEIKKPLTTYNGPEALGSVILQYPKTWSGYANDPGGNGTTLDLYFSPNLVPPVGNQSSIYALHLQIVNQPYSQVVQGYNAQVKGGKLTAAAYTLPKLPNVLGTELSGTFANGGGTGTLVLLPLRSETIELTTYTDQYLNDFNTYILKNFSFSP